MVVGPHLVFTDCSYTVTVTKDGKPSTPLTRQLCAGSMRPKRLIKGIAAEVRAGHVLAILGPSGAGKTTLLNMLTLEPKGGEPVGHLKLNGKPCTFETYNNYCAYVQQFDALWPMLTARDHLNFAFSLFQPDLSSKQRAEAIVRAAPTHPHTRRSTRRTESRRAHFQEKIGDGPPNSSLPPLSSLYRTRSSSRSASPSSSTPVRATPSSAASPAASSGGCPSRWRSQSSRRSSSLTSRPRASTRPARRR